MSEFRASYIGPLLNHRTLVKVVNTTIKALRPFSQEFDAIAFRGMSGALIVPTLAMRLKKHLILVRKRCQRSNSSRYVEGLDKLELGSTEPVRVLIVDDFIDTGYTVAQIIEEIKVFNPTHKIVGIWQYSPGTGNNKDKNAFFTTSIKGQTTQIPIWDNNPPKIIKKGLKKAA